MACQASASCWKRALLAACPSSPVRCQPSMVFAIPVSSTFRRAVARKIPGPPSAFTEGIAAPSRPASNMAARAGKQNISSRAAASSRISGWKIPLLPSMPSTIGRNRAGRSAIYRRCSTARPGLQRSAAFPYRNTRSPIIPDNPPVHGLRRLRFRLSGPRSASARAKLLQRHRSPEEARRCRCTDCLFLTLQHAAFYARSTGRPHLQRGLLGRLSQQLSQRRPG